MPSNLIRAKQLASDVSGLVYLYTSELYLPFASGGIFATDVELAASGAYLESLFTSGNGTVLSITGSSPVNSGNLSGIGGSQVIHSGDFILFSGGGGTATIPSDVVRTTGTQIVSGIKVFANRIVFNPSGFVVSGGPGGSQFILLENPNTYQGRGGVDNPLFSGNSDGNGTILTIMPNINCVLPRPIGLQIANTGSSSSYSFFQTFVSGTSVFLNNRTISNGLPITDLYLGGNFNSSSGFNNVYITDRTGNVTANLVTKELTGDWLTNTNPTKSGHLVNLGYIDGPNNFLLKRTGINLLDNGDLVFSITSDIAFSVFDTTNVRYPLFIRGDDAYYALSGDWLTNTQPTQPLHIINKEYLEDSGRVYNHVTISQYYDYIYTGLNNNETWVYDALTITGWRIGAIASGTGPAHFSSGSSGTPIMTPLTGNWYQRGTGNTTGLIAQFSFNSGVIYLQNSVNNITVSGLSRIGLNLFSGLSGIQGVTFSLFGYLS